MACYLAPSWGMSPRTILDQESDRTLGLAYRQAKRLEATQHLIQFAILRTECKALHQHWVDLTSGRTAKERQDEAGNTGMEALAMDAGLLTPEKQRKLALHKQAAAILKARKEPHG